MKSILEKMKRPLKYIRPFFRRPERVYRNLSIRLKLLVVLNAVILIPLILISFISYVSSENVIKNQSTQYSHDILKMIELRLSDNIANLNTISQNAVYDERIYDPIQQPDLSYEDTNNISDYLKNIILNVHEIRSICIYTNSGDYISVDSNETNQSIDSIIPPGSSQFNTLRNEARSGDGAPVWYIDNEKTGCNILYTRTIYNRDNYNEIGFVAILVNTDYFSSTFENVKNNRMQNIAVISEHNDVVLSKKGSDMRLLTPQDIETMGNDGWMIDKTSNILITYSQMGNPHWKVVSFVPLPKLYADIENLRKTILLSCAISILVISLVSFYIAYDFINSINKLVTGMKKVQQGDEHVYIELNRKDEIGYMGETFNNMVHEISMLENWVYHEQLTRKEAEIKSLQAQINPHFLFNTLESVNWMAQLENVPKISETVTSLASLMEANMSRTDRLISLKAELGYVDDYMKIMKNRFEDRIALEMEIDPESLHIEIPRLLIQPIVENAVQHGIGKTRRKGIIRLRTQVSGSELHILVEDNGVGIPPEKLKTLNRSLSADDDAYYERLEDKKPGGIGLENVNRRIKLYYGSAFGVSVESEQDVYTRVRISIPYKAQ